MPPRLLLFLYTTVFKKSRIEVGYGYEGVLTDIESNKLLLKFSRLNEEEVEAEGTQGVEAAQEEGALL